jgi:5-methylcytosine-specific restriction protein A
MPPKPFYPCRKAGCGALVQGGGYCDNHKQESGWQHTSKLSRHKRGYGTAWVKLRENIMRRDRRLCRFCLAAGRYVVATEVDHITPKAKGGTDESGNLQALCSPCHKSKTAIDRRLSSLQG